MKLRKMLIRITVLILLIVFFVMFNIKISSNREKSFKICKNGTDTAYDIEDVEDNGKEYLLHGWFFELKSVQNEKRKVENEKGDFYILLVDQEDSTELPLKGLIAEMEYSIRNDVNSYFECEYDYSRCGFIASFDKSDVEKEHVYRIYIKADKDGYSAIETKMFMYDGSVFYSNPLQRTPIISKSNIINRIISDGILIVNREDYGFYIYQCGRELYWIADKNAHFDEKSTYMEYMLATTQFDRLPLDRIEKELYWDNLGGSFEEYELDDCGDEGYRVMVRRIPDNYSVVYISLGYCVDGKWIWNEIVRPCYPAMDERFR